MLSDLYIAHTMNMYIQSDVEAGCHPVAIAQVVEHDSLSQRPSVQSQVAAGFSQLSKNIPKPFHHVSDLHIPHTTKLYIVHTCF